MKLNAASHGHLAMLAFSALIAGSFSLGSLVANEIAPAVLNAVRFLLAAVIIGALGAATGVLNRAVARAPWRYLILGGLFATYFVLMFEGLKTAAPVSSAAVFTLAPIISAAFGWILLRQITTVPMAAALAIGGAGAIWVIFRADWAELLAFRVGGRGDLFLRCHRARDLYADVAVSQPRRKPNRLYVRDVAGRVRDPDALRLG